MNKEKLKTHLLVGGKVTFYSNKNGYGDNGQYWAASFSKFWGFGKTGDEALDALAIEICAFKEGLDQLESKVEIDNGIAQQIIGNATIQ